MNVALESTRTIEIDEFVDRSEIDPRYLIRPYYLCPDGKVGHDAFAVIHETIREMNKVAIGRVVLTNREHIIALEPMDKGLMGTLLRYPYEVRSADEYFDDIQDVKVTKDMLDLAKHIVNQKAGHFEPDKFEDQYETALIDLINKKRAGKPITPKERPRGENVADLMDALLKSIGGERRPRALATADRLAEAVSLDMTGYWRPTARSYLGRVTKARILEAVCDGVSGEAAERMADMKKVDMAEAAEQLLAATDWLPSLLRTGKPQERTDAEGGDAYSEAAE